MCGTKLSQNKKTLVAKVKAARRPPKGLRDRETMLDSIMQSCHGKPLILTGNYVVREDPGIGPSDSRLLGQGTLLTMKLCTQLYGRCIKDGIEPPTLLLVLNDHSRFVNSVKFSVADLNAKLLQTARRYKGTRLARELLDKGADVDARSIKFGSTPLMKAAGEGEIETMEMLISRGAKLDARDYRGQTALMYAVKNGCRVAAGLLISKGADVNAKNNWGSTALTIANSLEIRLQLRRHGAISDCDSITETVDKMISSRNQK
jgi:hypothetical protein